MLPVTKEDRYRIVVEEDNYQTVTIVLEDDYWSVTTKDWYQTVT